MNAGAVVEQFTRQAASFARLPSHEASTELLLDMAGVGAGSEVLDVACGPGLVACAAAKRAVRVVGVDLTPAMIEQAKRLQAKLALGNIDWRIGEATALPFESGRFDAVMTRYSAHHFPDPGLVFAEMRRLAKPGARVTIADMVLPARNAAAYDRMERLRDPSHVRTLSREELGALAVAAGLQDLQWADYRFPLELERLLRASFPEPGNAERVRAMLEADVGVDAMGIGLHRRAGDVLLSYPVVIVSGVRRS
jgi:SAM-dependent methyltransferase